MVNIDKKTLVKDVSYIGARLREPSTYNALGILAAVVGVSVSGPVGAAIATIGAGVGALIGALLPDPRSQ